MTERYPGQRRDEIIVAVCNFFLRFATERYVGTLDMLVREALGSRKQDEVLAAIWIHGMPANSWGQVSKYLDGDAHDRSKVQILLNGTFHGIGNR